MACPTRARAFGDLGDPDSTVSKSVVERDGVAPLEQLGYRPTNRYLPPRPRRTGSDAESQSEETLNRDRLPPLLRWVDRVLSR